MQRFPIKDKENPAARVLPLRVGGLRTVGADPPAWRDRRGGQAEPGRGLLGRWGSGSCLLAGPGGAGPGGRASRSASGRLGSGSERLPRGPGSQSSSAHDSRRPAPAGAGNAGGARASAGILPLPSPGLAGGNLTFTPGQEGSGRAHPRSVPGRVAGAGTASCCPEVDRRVQVSSLH